MVPMIRTPVVMAVSNQLAVTTWSEFLRVARSRPLNCAGSGASTVFVGKYMMRQLNIDSVQFVPFRGTSDMITQLVAGNLDCAFETRFLTAALAQEQKLRVLAVSSQNPDPLAPEGRRFQDTVPGLVFYNWSGVSILKTVNADQRNRVFAALRGMAQDAQARSTMAALGVEVVSNPQINDAWLESEYQRWEQVRQQLNIATLD